MNTPRGAGSGIGQPSSSEPEPFESFQRLVSEGRIPFQRCQACSAAVFYPRVLCPECGSLDLGWENAAGGGIIYSTTTVINGDGSTYAVCLVDLDEGFRMMSTVVGADAADLAIGERVRGFVQAGDSGPTVSSGGEPQHPRVVFAREGASDGR